jgi:antitoxin (DNA-binding transcriptional repressor) of toxin-antitoxin stability system
VSWPAQGKVRPCHRLSSVHKQVHVQAAYRGDSFWKKEQIFSGFVCRLRKEINRLKTGLLVLIVDCGRPVARLVPVIGTAHADPDGSLSRLLRAGVIRPRRNDPPQSVFRTQAPRIGAALTAVDALLEDRREGR